MIQKERKGITLIALVITIVILLILAGVTIGAIVGENGLIIRTEQAKKVTRYKEAKEKINIELMEIQAECTEQRKEYNIKEIALKMKDAEEITINKTYNKEVASISEGIQIDEENVEAIVVSVDKYSEYKFLIGESTKIEGVLQMQETDTIAKSDFIEPETFEQNLLRAVKMEDTIITYITNPEGYTNQDSIQLTLKISNTKGIKTIEFPDGGVVECFGKTEYSKDYQTMVNGTYTYKITDMEGNETTKEVIVDKIDKLPPKDFTPEVQNNKGIITIKENGEDAEADETSSKSGIAYYEYYIVDENNVTIKYETNQIDNLAKGNYTAYVIAYDKAGNSKKSNEVEYKISMKFLYVLAGREHSLGIDNEGNLWAWGNNYYGQLGDGTRENKTSPVKIKSEIKFKQVSAGQYHSLAIDESGNLWAWGKNDDGQLGDGTRENKTSPVQINSEIKFKQVSAGHDHSLAIDEEGNLWAWGRNDVGQVGDGTTTQRTSPVQIKAGTKFNKISAGKWYSLAIDSEGNLWAWGRNDVGQVGKGTFTSSETIPIQIKEGTKFKHISAGYVNGLAIDEGGNLWIWGSNGKENLGVETTETKVASPVQIKAGTKFSQVSEGYLYSLAIDSEGNLWAWGWNSSGQLGDGTIENKTSPIQIKSGTKFKIVSAAAESYHSLAIDSEGNLWVWGYNGSGQLGDGTTKKKTSPVQI